MHRARRIRCNPDCHNTNESPDLFRSGILVTSAQTTVAGLGFIGIRRFAFPLGVDKLATRSVSDRGRGQS